MESISCRRIELWKVGWIYEREGMACRKMDWVLEGWIDISRKDLVVED